MNEEKLSKVYRDARAIMRSDGPWIFEKWDMCPGPGVEDFWIIYHSRRDYLQAVLRYHLGSPSIIDGWIVPLHKHPELTLPGVKHAIAEAINVSSEAFEGIAERRYKRTHSLKTQLLGHRPLGRSPMSLALKSQFIRCSHKINDTIALHLRRDMQETYIVHGSKL